MLAGLLAALPLRGADAPRVPGSPYPTAPIPDTVFLVADDGFPEAQRLIVESLQGSLSGSSAIYRTRTGGYALWQEEFSRPGGPVIAKDFQRDFPGLLRHYRTSLRGYVLCDLHTPSANAAISLCGTMRTPAGGVIAATTTDAALLDGLGLPRLADARGHDEAWALAAYPEAFNHHIVVYQDTGKDLFLGDYSVFAGALHFSASLGSPLLAAALGRMRGQAVLLGWGDDEFNLVASASKASVQVHAADWVLNLSTLSRFAAATVQVPMPAADSVGAGKHTVCFLMSDGDNLQWALGGFAAPGGKWYGNPSRGKLAMGWTMAPSLAELAPTALARLYRTASVTPGARDHFVAGPSGAGYIFPEAFAALDSAAVLTARCMAKADMRILNVLGNDPADKYLHPFLKLPGIDAILFYPYSDYSGLRGSIRFLDGKPVIGGFANLWEGMETPASLAVRLNARPKDPRSAEGYSLIPVHAWSRTLADVEACAALLGPDVRVVAPDEFVRAIRANLGSGIAIRVPKIAKPARSGAMGGSFRRGGRVFQSDGRQAPRAVPSRTRRAP